MRATTTANGVRAWSTTLVASSLVSRAAVSARPSQPQASSSSVTNTRAARTLAGSAGRSRRSACRAFTGTVFRRDVPTNRPGRRLLPSPVRTSRLQAHAHGVDAVAVAGRRLRGVVEQMPQVGAAGGTPHLRADHAVRAVLEQLDVVLVGRLVEARPAAVGVEL